MKSYFFLIGIVLLFTNCNKDKVQVYPYTPISCQLKDSVSYTEDISSIIIPSCTPCHLYPGAGGINLDTYENIKLQAQSGQLVQSIIHDSNYVIMPPPPLIGLDSCQIKSIKRWISQGCLNN